MATLWRSPDRGFIGSTGGGAVARGHRVRPGVVQLFRLVSGWRRWSTEVLDQVEVVLRCPRLRVARELVEGAEAVYHLAPDPDPLLVPGTTVLCEPTSRHAQRPGRGCAPVIRHGWCTLDKARLWDRTHGADQRDPSVASAVADAASSWRRQARLSPTT